MKSKMLFLFLSITIILINSHDLLFSQSNSILNKNNNNILKSYTFKDLELIRIFLDTFKNFYPNCSKEIEELNYKLIEETKYPPLASYIGITFNDLEDEIECLDAFENTIYNSCN